MNNVISEKKQCRELPIGQDRTGDRTVQDKGQTGKTGQDEKGDRR